MGYRLDGNIESAIRTLVVNELAVLSASSTVIWDRPKKPGSPANRPDKPYASLFLMTPPISVSQKNYKGYKTTDVWTNKKVFSFRVQVDIYTDSGLDFDWCGHFSMVKSFVRTSELLTPKGLELVFVGDPSDTTTLISNGYEPRSTFEMEFRYEKTIDETIGQINSVGPISATFTYEGEDI